MTLGTKPLIHFFRGHSASPLIFIARGIKKKDLQILGCGTCITKKKLEASIHVKKLSENIQIFQIQISDLDNDALGYLGKKTEMELLLASLTES